MAFPITWHKKLIADFIQAARDSRPPQVDGLQARRLNELCDAIYESARELRVIKLQ
jgi:predicted dehydrogenase